MSSAELKNQLIRTIIEMEDVSVLNRIESLLMEEDWWNAIPITEKEGIERGLKDIEDGKVVSHQDVRNKVSSLFKKK